MSENLNLWGFNFGVQRTCTIGKCPGIHIMVVLRNTECGVEETPSASM